MAARTSKTVRGCLFFEYAYQLYYIKNAEKINAGQASPEQLGVKVLDDKTL